MRNSDRITAGALEDLELSEIVQVIVVGRKTGCVVVTTAESAGSIWFVKGRAVHARTQSAVGEAAFYQMMTWETGKFTIEHDVTCRKASIDQDTTFLVLEGMRLRDEGEHCGGGEALPETAVPSKRRLVLRLSLGVTALTVVVAVAAGLQPLRDLGAESILPGPPLLLEHGAAVVRGVPDAVSRPAPGANTVRAGDRIAIVPAAEEPPAPVEATPPEPPPAGPDVQPFSVAELLASLEAAAARPSAVETERPSAAEPAPLPPAAYLELHARSSVKRGTLTVVVDGREVYSTELADDEGGTKRFFKKIAGLPSQEFSERLAVGSGNHQVVARLVRSDKNEFESAVDVELEPGQVEALRLVVGRTIGQPVVWKVVDRARE